MSEEVDFVLKKSDDQILNDILDNIVKMFHKRGDIKDIKSDLASQKPSNDIYELHLDNNTIVYILLPKREFILKSAGSIIGDFLSSYQKYKKLIVVDQIVGKNVEIQIKKNYPNTEVFQKSFFQINLLDHCLMPYDVKVMNKYERKQFDLEYNINDHSLQCIFENDPLVKYFNAKKNDILEITRLSNNSGFTVTRRRVREE